MPNQIHLLGSRRFAPLFVTQFFGAFNDNAFKNAFLIWFTYDIAAKSGIDAPMMVTLAAGLFILPFFILSATAGQVADKYERSWLSQKIKQAEIVIMLACAVCFYLQSLYGLLAVLFLMGVQSTFFGPIKYSLLPEHLEEDELIGGNGLIEGGTFLSILLGTMFGGLVILTEYGAELLSSMLIGFAIVGWIGSRSIPKAPIWDADLKVGWNIAAETWKIIGHAREERTVWLSIVGISWFWVIGATFLTQFPTYTLEVIGGNEQIVTLFLTTFSVGIGLGSVWCNKLLKGEIDGRLVPAGAIGMTLATIAFFVFSRLFVENSRTSGSLVGFSEFIGSGTYALSILLSLLALSICAGIYIVPLYTIMQHRSNDRYLSRIIAANNVLNALFMVLASVTALALFSLSFDVTDILLTMGISNIFVLLILRDVVRPRLDRA